MMGLRVIHQSPCSGGHVAPVGRPFDDVLGEREICAEVRASVVETWVFEGSGGCELMQDACRVSKRELIGLTCALHALNR